MIRIYKIEKFIPKTGNPVFQISEEMEAGGRVLLLDPRNPTAEELSNADEQFAAAQQTKITELTSDRDAMRQQISEATEQIAALQNSVDELAETREQLATAQAALTEANAKIVELQNALPWDVRIIDAAAFVARVTPTELLDLAGSADQVRQQIAQMLLAYKKNDWPILLDSPEMQQAIGYLVQSGSITQQRAAQLLRDSTREEAYKAGD